MQYPDVFDKSLMEYISAPTDQTHYCSRDQKATQMLLDDKVIEIKFINPSIKAQAVKKFCGSLYRQDEHSDYIYAFCNVKDSESDPTSC